MTAKKKGKAPRFGANVARNAEKRQQQGGAGRGWYSLPKDIGIFKEHETDKERIKLDIIPYLVTSKNHPDRDSEDPESAHEGNYWYKRPVWLHYKVGAENKTEICLKSKNKKCPICEYRREVWDQYNRGQIDKKEAQKTAPAKPQLRYLYIVIPIDHKDYEEKLHIWEISNGNFQEVVEEDLKESPEYGDFPSLEGGRTLEIRFSPDSVGDNKYVYASNIKYKERKEDYDETLLDEVPKLDDLLQFKTYKELEAEFMEMDEEDMEAGEDDKIEEVPEDRERPKKSYRKQRREEPEEDEDDKEQEEFEEDEKPKKKSTSKPRQRQRQRKEKEEPEEDEKEESQGDDKCPHGHEFGEDWDEYDECPDCKLYVQCGEENERLEK